MMPRSIDELRADVDELKRLLELCSRQSVKDWLLIEVRKLETEITNQLGASLVNVQTKPSTTPATSRCYDVKLTNYAWDQSDKFFKLFVTLNNIQNIPPENVSCTFTDRSIELVVKELEGKNYTLTLKNLAEKIEPSRSHWKVKTDMVIVFLAKEEPKVTWSTVTLDEKKLKEAKTPKMNKSESDDPQASMMNLMKQLYEEGDDEMKRTIAKAFVESRNKTSDIGL